MQFKKLREQQTQAAPVAKQPAAQPVQQQQPAVDQNQQLIQQATAAIEQIVGPIITKTIQSYLQQNLPTLLQNAIKGRDQQPQAKPAAPATTQKQTAQPAVAQAPAAEVPKK